MPITHSLWVQIYKVIAYEGQRPIPHSIRHARVCALSYSLWNVFLPNMSKHRSTAIIVLSSQSKQESGHQLHRKPCLLKVYFPVQGDPRS